MARFAVGSSPFLSRPAKFLVLLFSLLPCLRSSGQSFPATGTPPFNSFGGGPFDIVNLGNLNYHFAVPVFSRAGRGLSFYYNLTDDSFIYTPVNGSWTPGGGWGWQSQTNAATGWIPIGSLNVTSCGQGENKDFTWTFPGFVDQLGTYHHVPGLSYSTNCGNPYGTSITADDGSGYTVTMTSGSSGYATSVGGKTWNVPVGTASGAATITDPNGNQITTSDGVTFYDTLSSTTPVLTISGTNPVSYTYTASSGSVAYKVYYTSYNIKTNFQCNNIAEYSGTGIQLISSIVLPDGSKYSFTYEPNGSYYTGRVATVTLPSGGTITYSYPGANSGINCADGSTLQLTRTLNPGGKWTYARSGSGTSWQTTVSTPPDSQNQNSASDVTVIKFSEDSATLNPSQNFYETQRQIYQGAATGTPLEAIVTCYNGNTSGCSTAAVKSPITEVNAYRQFNGGPQARVDTILDSSQLPIEVDRYDFGASSPSQRSVIAYATINGNPSIIDRPACVQVTDGTKPSSCSAVTSHTASLTTYSNYDSKGNVGTVSNWVSGSIYLSRSFTYYSTGLLSTLTDVNNAQTNYSYNDCNSSLLSGVTYPISGLSTSQVWDCNGGVVTSTTDFNGNATSYTYNDSLWRLTAVNRPDGGSTSYTFNTGNSLPWTVSVTTAVSSTQNATTTSTLDGLARSIATSATDPNNTNGQLHYVNTVYNNLGQIYSVTNPFFSTSDPTYELSYYTYDALGRTTQIQHPSGVAETFSYSNRDMKHVLYPVNNAPPTVTPTKIYQIDGMGRLTDICEVTGVTQANGAIPAACNLDIAGTGFHSANTYDALGDVLSMASDSGPAYVFTYDGLSRTTSAKYPEQSTPITYTYNTSGDLSQRVALAPNQLQNGNALLTTTYSHDAMHRLTGITYSDHTTPNTAYYYDQSSVWSQTLSNPKGRLTAASAASVVNAIYGYDQMGRVALHGQCTPLNCAVPRNFFAHYGYNYIGEPLNGADYNGIQWTNTYNSIGQLSEVDTDWLDSTESGTIVSKITYNALGEPVSDSFANFGENNGGTSAESWNYNKDGHVTTYGQNPAPGYNYGFSPGNLSWNGNFLVSSSDNVNGAWSYSYDDFGRLATATQSGGQAFTYSYDQYGNRWATMTGPNQYTFSGTTNQITQNLITYDAAGNMTADGFHTYTYDGENRLTQVDSSTQYIYDSFGNRVSGNTPNGSSEFIVDLSGRAIASIRPGSDQVYTAEVFAGGRHWVTDNGSALFIGADWVGTSRAITGLYSLGGGFNQLYNSYPWGDNLTYRGGYNLHTTSQFAGKEYDTESGLYHFPARQYAPVQGRWLTPDPSGLAAMDPTNPQSWNRYVYVQNNPVSRIDPLGLDDCSAGGGDNDGGGDSAGGGDDGGGGNDPGDAGCEGPYGCGRDDRQVRPGASSGYWRGILGGGHRSFFRYGTFGMYQRRHRWGSAHAFEQNCSDPNSGTTQTISTYSDGTISLDVTVDVIASDLGEIGSMAPGVLQNPIWSPASGVANDLFLATGFEVSAPWAAPALFTKGGVAVALILAQIADVYESVVEPANLPNVHVPEDDEEPPGEYQGQEGAPISGPPD